MKKLAWVLVTTGLAVSLTAQAADTVPAPYRVKPNTVDWQCAQNMSQFIQVDLQDAHLADQNKIDDKQTEIHLLMKKSFGHGRYEYIYYMVLHPDHGEGKPIALVAVGTTEAGECPSDNIKTYLVSRQFGQLPTLH